MAIRLWPQVKASKEEYRCQVCAREPSKGLCAKCQKRKVRNRSRFGNRWFRVVLELQGRPCPGCDWRPWSVVHHISPQDHEKSRLVGLCRVCHARIHHVRCGCDLHSPVLYVCWLALQRNRVAVQAAWNWGWVRKGPAPNELADQACNPCDADQELGSCNDPYRQLSLFERNEDDHE